MGRRSTAGPKKRRRPRRAHRKQLTRAKAFARDIVVILLVAVVVSVGIKTYILRSFYIPSPSMTNTLQVNDRIVVNELVPGIIPLQHGDVVVFTDPGGWLTQTRTGQQASQPTGLAAATDWVLSLVGLSAQDSSNHLIKRIIGLPGDKVACCNSFGQLTVNGVALDETSYINLSSGDTRGSATAFSVTVPADSLWVMGDNRNNSEDSRFHASTPTKGFVPESAVVGRAFVLLWPVSRWTWLDDHPSVFAGVDK